MKAKIRTLKGNPRKKKVSLPSIFKTPYRPDLIKRDVLAIQSKKRQNYGVNKKAGQRTSAHYHGSRDLPPAQRMMNRELSRMPRHHGDTPRHIFMRGALVPHAVGGRRAHPSKPEKKFEKKINKKESRLALKSAISGTKSEKLVKERNHKFDSQLPLIVDNEIEKIIKTKKLIQTLKNLGLEEELKRTKERKIRAGKGKKRGRKYKQKKGILIVVSKDRGIRKAGRNIPGLEVSVLDNLNTELLSPGAHGVRLTVWSKNAVKQLKEKFS